ncbi:MAG: TraC family protein [Pseudomonadota bacterium]
MPKSLTKLKEEQAKLLAEIKKIEDKEALRIGKMALSSGLMDLDVSDGDLKKLFQDAGAAFRKNKEEPTRQVAS